MSSFLNVSVTVLEGQLFTCCSWLECEQFLWCRIWEFKWTFSAGVGICWLSRSVWDSRNRLCPWFIGARSVWLGTHLCLDTASEIPAAFLFLGYLFPCVIGSLALLLVHWTKPQLTSPSKDETFIVLLSSWLVIVVVGTLTVRSLLRFYLQVVYFWTPVLGVFTLERSWWSEELKGVFVL